MEGYEVICPIGQGSFSKVFKIKRKSDESIFVWKEMDFSKITEKEKQQIVAEVNILRELKHPNIVKYYDRIVDKQNAKIYIIMEYCEGGDLAQFLKKLRKQKSEFPEEAIWKILSQIILALYEIHKRKEGKILHRDIKPANIFLDSSNNVKIGDFGLARILGQESEYAQTSVGTPYYMSPELIDENKYNDKSDIWAVGCLLYEICALNPPFTAQNYLTLAMKIKQGVYQRIPQKYSNEMSRVIGWCLQKDEKNRPSVDDMLNIPQMSQRLREKRLKENTQVIQRREDAIQKKEENLKDLEIRIKQRQKELEKLQISLQKNGENKENLKFGQDLVQQLWIQRKEAGYLPINQSKIELQDKNNTLNQLYEF